jgi:GNAT superfamily N-acetyltransferase
MPFTIRTTDVQDDAARRVIFEQLIAYNTAKTGRNDARLLVCTIDDAQGKVLGGLWGRTAYDWLFVELLFVPESLRQQGVGADLMRRAESEALARGCHSAWLDTFQFQAKGFYEKLGYSCFGELQNYPDGASRYWMRKTLTAAGTDLRT